MLQGHIFPAQSSHKNSWSRAVYFQHCMCRVSSWIPCCWSHTVSLANSALSCALLLLTVLHWFTCEYEYFKSVLCKVPSCSVVITLDSAVLCQTVLCRAAPHAATELSRGGCSSGQVGIDAICHHFNHSHILIIFTNANYHLFMPFSLFTFRTCLLPFVFPAEKIFSLSTMI